MISSEVSAAARGKELAFPTLFLIELTEIEPEEVDAKSLPLGFKFPLGK